MENKNKFRSILMKGLKWSFISTFFLAASSVFYYALLTRYLSPEDFGVFSIALIFIGFLDFFSGAGLSAVVIQEKKISAEQLSSFFWINIGIGFILTLIIWVVTPGIVSYFENESIGIVLYISSGTVIFNAISLVHNNLLRKELQIIKAEKIEMVSTAFQILVGIYLAMTGYSLYSLPVSFLVGKIVSCFGYLIIGSTYFRPKFLFNYHSVKRLISLGTYQIMEKFFNYLRANIDKFLIGKFLGADSLGYYTLAQKLVYFPLSKINPGLNKILFPYFSKLQDRPKIMAKLYQNILSFLMVSITPFLLFIIVFSDQIVSLVFDPRYAGISELVRILSILGLLKSFSNIGGNVLNSLGKFKIGFIWNFWWSISLSAFILTGLWFGYNLTEITYLILIVNLGSFFAWHRIIYQYFHFNYSFLVFKFLKYLLIYGLIIFFFYMLNIQFIHPPFRIYTLAIYGILLVLITLLLTVKETNPIKNIIFRGWN